MNIFHKVEKTGQMNCPVFGVDLVQRCIQAVDPPLHPVGNPALPTESNLKQRYEVK